MDEEIKLYGNVIFKYCFGILCDYHEAQDAVQETFAKAYFSQSKLKSQESFKAWLYKIAYNVCMNILRKRRRYFSDADDTIAARANASDSPFIDPDLTEALLVLSPQDRALFYSRAVDGTDYEELSKLYGVRAATLRKRYERAKTKLKNFLTERSVSN
ncbi:MAG: sigma-70 family RNA polymerase sigma factor [Defluviitaleaceae bacterium]|nr:sigma-70 family RNA polymerase sigma factor [Defluviitaleaceae bacterium]